MTFVFTAALLIGLLATIPLWAHLLRRGGASPIPFPAARLIPAREHVAKRRSRFQDRALLASRVLILITLALLGAIPLVRCDRAVLLRDRGASIAAVIVLDDSASMRSRLDSRSRLERAKSVALELSSQLKEGDSIGLVLAGKPARMHLLPTSNGSLLRQQIRDVVESDRPTDLAAAIALAESALDRHPQVDKQVLVLSDLATELPPSPSKRVLPLLPELWQPMRDCAILSALRSGGHITVEIACSNTHPKLERRLQLFREAQPNHVVREKSVAVHPGRESQVIEDPGVASASYVKLLGSDDNSHDDRVPVVDGTAGPTVAIYADPAESGGKAGAAPLLEQALLALDGRIRVRPLPMVPELAQELANVDLLLLDNPPLISAEARTAITEYVQRGGVAVAFLGEAANLAQLGSLLLPFIEGRAVWEASAPDGLDPKSFSTLSSVAASFAELSPRGRLVFDESHDSRVVVKGRWSDQKPFWIERVVGRGLVSTFGLPTSVEKSDLALRTGFVAVLANILSETERRGANKVVLAGNAWHFPKQTNLRAEGPEGPLQVRETGPAGTETRVVVPTKVGRYRLWLDGTNEDRFALLPPEEVLESPRPWPADTSPNIRQAAGRLELSRPLTLALCLLLGLEFVLGSSSLRRLGRSGWDWIRRTRLPGAFNRSR
ncbi:MAG TPA: VWA domain-containing protein [Polyangiaceae bacterium]|nr:VWA domain-containing protein [Polyangiaceae bacterium]